jgi:hypothetical protein
MKGARAIDRELRCVRSLLALERDARSAERAAAVGRRSDMNIRGCILADRPRDMNGITRDRDRGRG